MNIEDLEILKELSEQTYFGDLPFLYYADLIGKLLTAYEKEKEKNKRVEELYMQHNQMIIDILKECDYMIKNRYYMNDVAIRQHTENIKNIAKYYIKEPEWIKIKEKQDNVK